MTLPLPLCSQFASLTDLNISHNMLKELPPYFGYMPQMRFLNISFNKVPDCVSRPGCARLICTSYIMCAAACSS